MRTQAQARQVPAPIRVGLLMLSPIGAEALSVAFGLESGIDVVLATANTNDFLEHLTRSRMDVVLVNTQKSDGLVTVLNHPAVRRGQVRAIVLSPTGHPDSVAAVRAHGASGFVLMSTTISEVVNAIRIVGAGRMIFPEDGYSGPPHFPAPSRRELQLLRTLRSGASNSEIADQLSISTRTVESHMRRLFARYGTASRAELLMLALRHQWVGLEPAEG